MQNVQELERYCLTFAGAVTDYPFGHEPVVMKVSGKMFALLGVNDEVANLSLKCDPFMGELLRMQYEAVKPGYHLNKRHWITVTIDGTVPEDELKKLIGESYELVVSKLTKAQRASLSQ
ncbi:MmcQ/YjbR family DNA-binding protein [Paenibacillaceae bacterium]|nr:MmcQ/YjbR family DNA-binding protein [Paenibacillaceae bacterium]